jgi:CNP1-like family protein
LKRLLLALLAALALPAAAQRTNNPGEVSGPQQQRTWEEDERRNRAESAVTLPPWPKKENLIEFHVSNATSFRFYVDAPSVSISNDNIVRYTLVARSAAGVDNISYEGMRCAEVQYRIYAYGQDGKWAARESEWRDIEPMAIQRWHNELRLRFFCRDRGTILNAAEGVDALRRGGLPGAATRPGS